MRKIIKLFSDILLVEGYTRAIIQDYNRKQLYYIPSLMADYIKKFNGKITDRQIYQIQKNAKHSYLGEYFTFLKEKELIFEIDESLAEYFPHVSIEYDFPFDIDNITLFVTRNSYDMLISAADKCIFEPIHCIILIVSDDVTFKLLKILIEILIKQESKYIQIIVNDKIRKKIIKLARKKSLLHAQFLKESIDKTYFEKSDYLNKFPIIQNDFTLYTEALQYNPYFNKTLFVDDNGNVKNAQETEFVGANINEIKNYNELVNLFNLSEMKKYRLVHKDMIEVCKDCELRYMCIDNRVPYNIGSHWRYETECSYNPYVCKWKNEENFISIDNCGIYSKEMGFIPDRKKIVAFNKQIWSEED